VASPDDLPPQEIQLIDAFAAHLALERRLSPNTVVAYRRDVTQLAVFLRRGGSSLPDAAYHQLRRFLALQHALGYARASIARRVGAIRTFYRWAARAGHISTDPARCSARPRW
jgi:integrase/recombinase XerC